MDTYFPFLPLQVLFQAAWYLSQSWMIYNGVDNNVWYSYFPTASAAFGLALGFSAERVASFPQHWLVRSAGGVLLCHAGLAPDYYTLFFLNLIKLGGCHQAVCWPLIHANI